MKTRNIIFMAFIVVGFSLYFLIVLVSAPTFEDFTTWTEANGDLSQTTTRASFTAVIRNQVSYLYKDYDANYFSGEIEHNFTVHISDLEAGDTSNRPTIIFYAVATTYGTDTSIRAGGVDYISLVARQIDNDDDTYRFNLQGSPTGVGNGEVSTITRNAGTTYYVTVARAADDTVTCRIYTDSARNTLSETLTLPTDVTEDLQYITVTASIESLTDPNDHVTGYVENLDLQEGDTCSCPSSGDWEVDAAEYCTIDTDCDIESNDFICTGNGEIYINADIIVENVVMGADCTLVFAGGKSMVFAT